MEKSRAQEEPQAAATADRNGEAKTVFVGHRTLAAPAQVLGLLVDGKPCAEAGAGAEVVVVLSHSPFLAEGSGQVCDQGVLAAENLVVAVEAVRRQGAVYLHKGKVQRGELKVGATVQAQVNAMRRRLVQTHHSAVHLLHAALRRVLGAEIEQRGALAAPERLRFEFAAPRTLGEQEVARVEQVVNLWVLEGHPLGVETMPAEKARQIGALPFPGEPYGEQVRVIGAPEIGFELCGGTHVSNTIEIGPFKIVGDSEPEAGVRRLEAVAGLALLDYLRAHEQVTRVLSTQFQVSLAQLPGRLGAVLTQAQRAIGQVEGLKVALALARCEACLGEVEQYGQYRVLVADLGDTEPAALAAAAEGTLSKLGEGTVVLGSAPGEDAVAFAVAFSPKAVGLGLHAGQFAAALAQLTGGGDARGNAQIALSAGRQPSRLKATLDLAFAKLYDTFNDP
ncbi:MAG: hypothetical protein KME03_13925 [Aphanocapsa lilacina HA4352-LM1]|jgi:alanyl-tRNA synthetase|nr:hypothetical protein [Aphanocapsa lilacina HA4352-LM1]